MEIKIRSGPGSAPYRSHATMLFHASHVMMQRNPTGTPEPSSNAYFDKMHFWLQYSIDENLPFTSIRQNIRPNATGYKQVKRSQRRFGDREIANFACAAH